MTHWCDDAEQARAWRRMSKRPACDRCRGTDCQRECEQGQCLAEAEAAQQERLARDRAEYEEAEMARHYSKHPHG